jgi:hypothetical protein
MDGDDIENALFAAAMWGLSNQQTTSVRVCRTKQRIKMFLRELPPEMTVQDVLGAMGE